MPELWAYELARERPMLMVLRDDAHQFSLVVASNGTDRSHHDGCRCLQVGEFLMTNSNRLLVAAQESHITEERRIEEKMIETDDLLSYQFEDLKTDMAFSNWNAVILTSRRIAETAGQLWLLDQRLQDVKQINEQFARIQAHIDRIEATDEEHGESCGLLKSSSSNSSRAGECDCGLQAELNGEDDE